jgi:predicted amidophosphoribosyltransferase
LADDDECYYLFEYTSNRDFSYGFANDLISNLKKSVARRANHLEYRYKTRAIAECSGFLAATLNDKWLQRATLVPIPPSKNRDDPLYDSRITQICRGITKPYPIDVRELVLQRDSIEAAHESDRRPTVSELLEIYAIDEEQTAPTPEQIGIVDDVLTAGTHYVAVKRCLSVRFPSASIAGIFIARRVFPTDELTEFFSTP